VSAAGEGSRRRAVAAWCLYDWANSAFPTIVSTFLFAAYVSKAVAPDPVSGTAAWGQMMSLTGLIVAILSPLLGAVADQGGRRKPWLLALSAVAILGTASLWYVRPQADDLLFALIAAGIATAGFELATVFYNALLPEVTTPRHIGRVSGWGWGLGYAGGLACLALALFVFVQPKPPPFGLDPALAEQVRIVGPLAAVWFAVFALPLFLFVPDRAAGALAPFEAMRRGIGDLFKTLRQVRRYANVARFLLAKMIYIEGLNTLFAFGGIYAAGSFGMGLEEVLLFGIVLNIAAGAGAFAFAWVDDWIGAKRTILISLGALMLLGLPAVLVTDKTAFYVVATGLGIFLGPAQAASRSLMARLAPPERMTEFFGLYSLAGKVTSFVGPALFGWITYATGSQRAGMAALLVFFLVGFILLLPVREPSRD
jgi:UMF1 family MFS transporter